MTTLTSTTATQPTSIDVAALELLCSLYLARKYGEEQPAAWCEDAPGNAAARIVGIETHGEQRFDAHTAFGSGFELGVRIAVAIASNPLGDVASSIDAEVARTRAWLAGFSSTP